MVTSSPACDFAGCDSTRKFCLVSRTRGQRGCLSTLLAIGVADVQGGGRCYPSVLNPGRCRFGVVRSKPGVNRPLYSHHRFCSLETGRYRQLCAKSNYQNVISQTLRKRLRRRESCGLATDPPSARWRKSYNWCQNEPRRPLDSWFLGPPRFRSRLTSGVRCRMLTIHIRRQRAMVILDTGSRPLAGNGNNPERGVSNSK
jgi:hypothetical protein